MRNFFLAFALLSVQSSNAWGAGPNFVIFIADDQGYGDLGCYGHPTLKTPHIDRLAHEGILFEAAFLTTSSCSPTRCSLLTGRYPHNTGAADLHDPLPADQKSIAQYLQQAGYYTASVGKWHVGDVEKQNWDRVIECQGNETGPQALKLLKERPQDQAFFLWVASVDPHRPYGGDGIEIRYSPEDVVVPPYLPDHRLIREELAQYYDEIARFDAHVGQILDKLQEEGILEDTFIVYLSDNGMPFPRAKTTLYDSGIRTPLLMRFPKRIQPGSRQASLVSTIDITSTIAEMAGIVAPTLQGQSLLELLPPPRTSLDKPPVSGFAAGDTFGREAVFAEANWHDFEQFTRAVRTERFLLVRNYYWEKPLWNSVDSINSQTWTGLMRMHKLGQLTPAQQWIFVEPRPFEEFYDLQLDPASLTNIIGDPQYRESVNRLRSMLDNWRVETGDVMPAEPRPDGWTRDGRPLPHNQPWYDRYIEAGGESNFEKF